MKGLQVRSWYETAMDTVSLDRPLSARCGNVGGATILVVRGD
jgi:hypothetical protein